MGDILSILLALIGIVAVLALTYYLSRWYARRMGAIASAKHMKLIDRLPLSKSGSLAIVEIAGKQYVAGISDQSVSLMMELEEPVEVPSKPELFTDGFSDLLKKRIAAIKQKAGKSGGQGSGDDERGVD